MLTVAEEFLVLTAGDSDDEATLPPITLTKTRLGIKVAMTGASLMELALRDRIETDLEQLWLRDPSPTGEPAVDDVLAGIVAIMPGNAAKMPIDDMIEKLEAIDSYQLALDSLKARGLVRERTERHVGLPPRACHDLESLLREEARRLVRLLVVPVADHDVLGHLVYGGVRSVLAGLPLANGGCLAVEKTVAPHPHSAPD